MKVGKRDGICETRLVQNVSKTNAWLTLVDEAHPSLPEKSCGSAKLYKRPHIYPAFCARRQPGGFIEVYAG
ncbi:hypothetical protein P8C59_006878 [Phyllachora maydis]|uniref:Uncharacterized protein n=1 Tax=Phyllachora maydis TaxID=1825666 RepID=A0AAD9I8I4_9PEZI|nr:hypothetical protein P8C59_006878 [Phyllachora maydis]